MGNKIYRSFEKMVRCYEICIEPSVIFLQGTDSGLVATTRLGPHCFPPRDPPEVTVQLFLNGSTEEAWPWLFETKFQRSQGSRPMRCWAFQSKSPDL